MTLILENESGKELPFDVEELTKQVIEGVLDAEGCPYEVQVNVLLTDNEGILEVNRESRGIDRATDVLSFPALEYEEAGNFDFLEEEELCFEPESGELMLGDILVSVDKVSEQAQEYGHSKRREYAFLIAHSMLHLCGYDHMEADDAEVMEKKQEDVLQKLGITRD